nr:hypothetical protein 20 [Pelagibacteraceae bacterium]
MDLTKEELVIVRNILNYHCIHNVSFKSDRHEEIQTIIDKISKADYNQNECGKEQ